MARLGLSDLLGEFELPSPDSMPPVVPSGQGEPYPTEITPPGRPDIYTAAGGPSIDDLLKQADEGKAVGTTQRYFKPGTPQPAPQAPPQPAPPAPLNPGGESEKEMIDRILGRKKQSMAPVMLAGGPSLLDFVKSFAPPVIPPRANGEPFQPDQWAAEKIQQQMNTQGPRVNRWLKDLVDQYNTDLERRP